MRVVTAIVILAAGASRRLGRPKQTEMLGGESLLARAVRVAREAAMAAVYVVVRAGDDAVEAEARRLPCEVVLNGEAEEGMASSIRAGVRAVDGTAAGAVVMTCDQPAVTAEHLRTLVTEAGGEVVASEYAGRRGVPAYFPAAVCGELLLLRGDAGAREMLRSARVVRLEGGELDVDTETELARARAAFG